MRNEPCRPTTASAIGESFDEVVLPHLDAAYRLALWLMRNEHDAEDVVQEACLRALRYFRTFTGGNARAWFLRIVRNTACGWHRVGFPPTDLSAMCSSPKRVGLHGNQTVLRGRAEVPGDAAVLANAIASSTAHTRSGVTTPMSTADTRPSA